MDRPVLLPPIISAEQWAHLERAGHPLFEDWPSWTERGGVRAGVGFHSQWTWLQWLPLRELCQTCLLCESGSPPLYLRFAGDRQTDRRAGWLAGREGEFFFFFWLLISPQQSWEPLSGEWAAENFEKSITAERKTAARLNFSSSSSPRGPGRRSQQVPGITIHLSLTACQHLTAACVSTSTGG